MPVQVKCPGVVSDGSVILPHGVVGAAAVEVGIGDGGVPRQYLGDVRPTLSVMR